MRIFIGKVSMYILLTCMGCFTQKEITAQTFGGNDSHILWQQINTDTVRIIFPKGLENQATRIASVLHRIQQTQDSSIGTKIRKINIVLQNLTTISNAYVGLAPYRSEYYLNYPQSPFELGATNWLDNLSIHEWRHVQQYSNFNKGLSKFASLILGEEGQALANSASVPDWFFEGDAVFNETKLSSGGRGRLPVFFSGFKSIVLNNLHYNYMQLRNGSLIKNIPNHYNLGYLLVAYGNNKYGNDFWQKVTSDAAAFKPLFYPMQGAVKKYSGISFKQFVSNALTFYENQWKQEASTPYEFITPLKTKDVMNYQYPYVGQNGDIIVLKNSNKKIPTFYSIDNKGNETKIAVKKISVDEYFSYNNGKIIYASYKPDARWGNKDFSQITILDIVTGKQQTIKQRSRYFSPDISHKGKKITAVEIDPTDTYSSQSKIVIMNTDGAEKTIVYSDGHIYSFPKFSMNDSSVYAISRTIDGNQNSLVKIKEGNIQTLYTTEHTIGFLQITADDVLFTATSGGKDELWSYRESNHHTFNLNRLGSIHTGLYKGDRLNDSTVIATTPTAYGYRLVKIKPVENDFSEMSADTGNNALYNIRIAATSEILKNISDRKFAVSKYRKGRHLFNFHSWRPLYERPEWSFTAYSENILNTLQTEAAYTYNENEKSHQFKYSAIYGGSFIQPYISVDETLNRTAVYNNQSVHWNEFNLSPGLQLPLDLSSGKQYHFLRLFASYTLEKVQWTGIAKNIFNNGSFQYLHSGISYSWQIQKAVQQIFPSFAQSISVQYKSMLNKYTANQLTATTSIYLPGLFNNHSLVIAAAFQSRDTANQYYYSNNFPFSRGYTVVDYPRMWKLSANYHLPILYPDRGIANIVYFLRVRGNLFYDHTIAKSLRTGNTFPFRTAGAELLFDTKWWNMYPVSFGVRYNRLLNNGLTNKANANTWEFILPVLF
ncbi:hypothetical protein LK994_06630 [Ferruginibacter lapsinanis]|uniref:hypothetical protein n=1 Tax=Ferruginibacter lapsinanis TaxID=563172 RepID=UPI001E3CDFB9|nr:hypothetical protein [Ferruginibacter lapsinanis]UEG51148.1 hypothetical protein LK994_06630 [Ferruginibacter lapsinanis]